MASLGVICARMGSKRLPGKNLRPLNGHPLIAYACRAARASGLDRVIVSTEDDRIAQAAAAYGVEAPFRRPAALAADYASSPDIVGHALAWIEVHEELTVDTLALLQPTTPFMLPEHIDACVKAVADGAGCAFTARPVAEPPQWMFVEEDGEAHPLLGDGVTGDAEHSQHLPKTWFPTGAVFAMNVVSLRRTGRIYCEPLRLVEMPAARSIDIDDELDLIYAETVARQQRFSLIEPCETSEASHG